jgi:hypothetical protein
MASGEGGLSAFEMAGLIGFVAFVCFICAIAEGLTWEKVAFVATGIGLIALAVWVYIVFKRWDDAHKGEI